MAAPPAWASCGGRDSNSARPWQRPATTTTEEQFRPRCRAQGGAQGGAQRCFWRVFARLPGAQVLLHVPQTHDEFVCCRSSHGRLVFWISLGLQMASVQHWLRVGGHRRVQARGDQTLRGVGNVAGGLSACPRPGGASAIRQSPRPAPCSGFGIGFVERRIEWLKSQRGLAFRYSDRRGGGGFEGEEEAEDEGLANACRESGALRLAVKIQSSACALHNGKIIMNNGPSQK